MPRQSSRQSAQENSSHVTAERSLFLEVQSEPMRSVLESVKRAAASDATILLIGESGTGKSVLARQIHSRSPRREKPFVQIDCIRLAQVHPQLETQGYIEGDDLRITKHVAERFAAANGGTLFLSATDQLSPRLRLEVARFVVHRTLRTSDGEHPIDVRIIAAADRELAQLVECRK